MIKKNIKSKVTKKTLLIILMICMILIGKPTISNAGIGISTITKPISGMIMRCIDGVNALLATLFATDAKVEKAIAAKNELNAIKNDDTKNIFKKISDGLDELEEAIYNLLLSPEDIFSGKVQITNANIFSSKFEEDGEYTLNDANLFNHLMQQLKQATAGLYYITRNLAIVILLCLLIYAGIRIVLASSVADEKAKWKEYIFDWLKALALVMFVHIIMIGIFYIAETITEGLTQGISDDGNTLVTEIRSNFDSTSVLDFTGIFVYIIMYAYITYLNIVFLIAYFKRLFYIITMIVVAPVISSLYALGKTGKPRFNKWLQEFVMGVMVQPFHLLIYSILILIPMGVMDNSGFTFFSNTVFEIKYATLDAQIYALIAISMIRPIEKFMRSIFGFTGTALDNVASYESGKKTLDKGVDAVVQTVETGVKVGAAIATGGTSLMASSASSAAGAAGAAGEAEALSEATSIASEDQALLEMGSNRDDWTENDENAYNELYDTQQQRKANFQKKYGRSSDDVLKENEEARIIDSRDKDLKELGHDKSGWTENDKKGYDDLNDEQRQRKVDFQEKYGRNAEDALKAYESGKEKKELKDGEKSEKEKSSTGSGTEFKLDSANIEIGNADLNNANLDSSKNKEIDSNGKIKLDGDNSKYNEKDNEKKGNKEDNSKDNRPKLGGQDLSTALLNKLGATMSRGLRIYGPVGKNISSRLNLENLSQSPLLAPEMLESYKKTADAWKEVGGTLGPEGMQPPSSHNNLSAKFISERKEQSTNNFVNNEGNIQEAIKVFKLDEKKNENTGKIISRDKQEELAREKLKAMAPYAGHGITDLTTIKGLMDRNIKPEQALQTLRSDNKGIEKYNSFVEKEENIQVLQQIEAGKLGKTAEFNAGDTTVIEQVNQQVRQTISDGRQYITSGAARDAETLSRLTELERKIDAKVNMTGSKHYSDKQYVVAADKIIEKAVAKNMKKIELPVNKKVPFNGVRKQENKRAEEGTKALEKVMNEELKRRKSLNP